MMKFSYFLRLILPVVACLSVTGFHSLAYAVEPPLVKHVVVIDLAETQGPITYVGSGFLHGMSNRTLLDSVLNPLRPQLFRNAAKGEFGGFETYPRIKGLGARSQIVISDSYGYKGDFPGDNNSYEKLARTIQSLLAEAKSRGQTHQWDLWNEPDKKGFWPRPRSQFFETWKRAVRQIRREDAANVIVGPSINVYNKNYLREFLLFARSENVLPDILSWHEIQGKKAPKITAHVAEMREFLKENQIALERIQINEHTSIGLKFRPGAAVWFLSQLESAKVEGAAKACWRDGSKSNCRTGTLDGLVTVGRQMPRPIWWAYKGYADLRGDLVKVLPSPRVSGIVTYERNQSKVAGLFGSLGKTGGVELHLKNLAALFGPETDMFEVRAGVIPYVNGGKTELTQLVTTIHGTFKARGGELRVLLPEFGEDDAYLFEMSLPKA